jgi:hypothetical protein
MNGASTDEAKVVVSVKKKHILAGKRISAQGCAVALALQEQFADPEARMVVMYAHVNGSCWRVDKKATDFVYKFDTTTDRGRKMLRPFKFSMVRWP